MVDGLLYFTAGERLNVIAVNAGTGETLWLWATDQGSRFDPQNFSRAASRIGPMART